MTSMSPPREHFNFENSKMPTFPVFKPISMIGQSLGANPNPFASNPEWLDGDDVNSMNVFTQKSYPIKAPNKYATSTIKDLNPFSSFDNHDSNLQAKTYEVKIPESSKKQPIKIEYEDESHGTIYRPPIRER